MLLKIERIKKNLSQEKLSKISNVSRATISQLEKGNIDSVKVATLKKIAAALDSSIEELFFSDNN